MDVVRGFAILMAIGWHLNRVKVNPLVDLLLLPGRKFGWAGVDLFFVLSGFLVGRMLLKERRRFGQIGLWTFYLRRILRLWPVLYVFLLSLLFLSGVSWRTYFFQIALHVQNYFHPKIATHLWSLAVEEQFYLVAATYLVFATRYRLSNAKIFASLCVVVVLAFALRLCAVHANWNPIDIQWQFQFRMDAIAAGVVLALISVEYPETYQRLLDMRRYWICIAIAGFVSLAFIAKDTTLGETIGLSLSWISSAALMLGIHKSGLELRARTLCSTIAVLGLVAYPLYLWHVPVAKFVAAGFEKLHIVRPGLLVLTQYLASITVAVLMRASIELPMMLWRDRISPARALAISVDQVGDRG